MRPGDANSEEFRVARNALIDSRRSGPCRRGLGCERDTCMADVIGDPLSNCWVIDGEQS